MLGLLEHLPQVEGVHSKIYPISNNFPLSKSRKTNFQINPVPPNRVFVSNCSQHLDNVLEILELGTHFDHFYAQVKLSLVFKAYFCHFVTVATFDFCYSYHFVISSRSTFSCPLKI